MPLYARKLVITVNENITPESKKQPRICRYMARKLAITVNKTLTSESTKKPRICRYMHANWQ